MAIKAYVSKDGPHTAQMSSTNIVPINSKWGDIENKPFETVDEETLSTEGGVLRFRTGSYEDLSDLPSIEGVKLVDDKSFEDLGMEECSILDIEKLFS